MPVLPEVGSTSIVPGPSLPSASSASIIDTPMRSLTLAIGLKNSSLSRRSAVMPSSAHRRGTRTSGVLPMVSAMLS